MSIRKKETKVYQQAAAEYQDDKSDLLYLSVILVLCESLLFRFTKKMNKWDWKYNAGELSDILKHNVVIYTYMS